MPEVQSLSKSELTGTHHFRHLAKTFDSLPPATFYEHFTSSQHILLIVLHTCEDRTLLRGSNIRIRSNGRVGRSGTALCGTAGRPRVLCIHVSALMWTQGHLIFKSFSIFAPLLLIRGAGHYCSFRCRSHSKSLHRELIPNTRSSVCSA